MESDDMHAASGSGNRRGEGERIFTRHLKFYDLVTQRRDTRAVEPNIQLSGGVVVRPTAMYGCPRSDIWPTPHHLLGAVEHTDETDQGRLTLYRFPILHMGVSEPHEAWASSCGHKPLFHLRQDITADVLVNLWDVRRIHLSSFATSNPRWYRHG